MTEKPELRQLRCNICNSSYLGESGDSCPQGDGGVLLEPPEEDTLEDEIGRAMEVVGNRLEEEKAKGHVTDLAHLLTYAQTLALIKIGQELERIAP